MSRIDRLSSLISRFELSVVPTPLERANLVILETFGDDAWCLALSSSLGVFQKGGTRVTFSAEVSWGGGDNPLIAALPEVIERTIKRDDELDLLVRLLVAEQSKPRCGSATVLNRLGEVLIVRILREAIEQGSTAPGVLGGLADARLSRALVAMHETPGRAWTIEGLASTAGMSRSRFSALFQLSVGETPFAYLRRWRMTLARQDLERGEQVQTVARRYGYSSGEALNRGIRQRFGASPSSLRKNAAGSMTV